MEILTVIVKLGALMFIVSSMLAMGFSLTVRQIIAPLKNLNSPLAAPNGTYGRVSRATLSAHSAGYVRQNH